MNSGELSQRIGRALRWARMERSMSLGDVAAAAGLSKSILSRLERGDGNPSIETLFRLAQALDLPLGTLIAEESEPRIRTIPSHSGEPLRGHSGMAAWLVHADGRGRRTELYDIDLPPDSSQIAEPHLPGAEEIVVCTSGRARVGPIGEEVALKAGDAAWFVSDAPHAYHAGARGARLLNLILVPVAGVA